MFLLSNLICFVCSPPPPPTAEEGWSAEAISFIKDAGNHMVSALVKCFEDGIPMVELYRYDNQTVNCICVALFTFGN